MAHSIPPEEIAKLMRYVAKKAENATTPFNLSTLCRQFRQETGLSVTIDELRKRIRQHRHQIYEMTEFDMERRVRMIFAVSAPVESVLLIELRKSAVVEVNAKQQITWYEQIGGGLKLGRKSTTAEPKKRRGRGRPRGKRRGRGWWRRKRRTVASEDSEDLEDGSTLNENNPSGDTDGAEVLDFEPPIEQHEVKNEVEDVSTLNENNLSRDTDDAEMLDFEPLIQQQEEMNDEEDMILVEQKHQVRIENISHLRPEITTTGVKELLVLLRGALLSVESLSLTGLAEKMEVYIQKASDEKKQFALEKINIPFDACLFLLMNNAAPKSPPNQESISLRDFLMYLKTVTAHINHQSLYSYHQKLKELIFELSARDQMVPVESVQRAIEATLIIIAP